MKAEWNAASAETSQSSLLLLCKSPDHIGRGFFIVAVCVALRPLTAQAKLVEGKDLTRKWQKYYNK
jgi:hypothetical protein